MFKGILQEYKTAWSLALIVVLWSFASWAHDLDEIEAEATVPDKESEPKDAFGREMEIVTASESRLKPRPFSQKTPLQVKTAVVDREEGLIDASKELQKATRSHKPHHVVQRLKFVGSVSVQSPIRTTFNSASPLQIISAQHLREAGRVQPKDIFQRTTRQVIP